MNAIISYDIACDKRRKQAAKVCLYFGQRVQKSVFLWSVPKLLFDNAWNQLLAQDDTGECAHFLACPVCQRCFNRRPVLSREQPQLHGPWVF